MLDNDVLQHLVIGLPEQVHTDLIGREGGGILASANQSSQAISGSRSSLELLQQRLALLQVHVSKPRVSLTYPGCQ